MHVQPGRTTYGRQTPRVAPSAFKSVVPTPWAGDTAKVQICIPTFSYRLERRRPRHPILKQAEAEYAKLQ